MKVGKKVFMCLYILVAALTVSIWFNTFLKLFGMDAYCDLFIWSVLSTISLLVILPAMLMNSMGGFDVDLASLMLPEKFPYIYDLNNLIIVALVLTFVSLVLNEILKDFDIVDN